MRRSLLLAIPPCVMAGACGSDNSDGGLVFRWDDVPPEAIVIAMDTMVQGDDSEDVRTLAAARARLLGVREEWTYGTLEGPDNTLWGWIRDVATDAEGNVYAIDGLLNLLRVLSPAGELIAETFRSGGGPMEARAPMGVELIGDTLVVFSSFDGLIYATGEPQELSETGRVVPQPTLEFEDGCAANTLLFLRISPIAEPASVQAVGLDGTQVGIFGDVFQHEDVSVRAKLSKGGIACSHKPERVVTSLTGGSLIHAYDYSGAPAWVAHLAGFRPPETRGARLGDGRLVLSSPGESPEDRVQKPIWLPGGLFLVQVIRRGPFREVDGRTLRKILRRDSYILAARSGVGVYVGPDLPEVLHVTEGRLFAMEADDELGHVILATYQW